MSLWVSLVQVVNREEHLRDRGPADGAHPKTWDQDRIKQGTEVKRLIERKKYRVRDI